MSKAFPFLNVVKNQRKKLFCFSHAGGSASAYLDWVKYSKEISVIPIELPGKNSRINEIFETDVEQLISDLCCEITHVCEANDQIFIYGHSMGAFLAFKVTAVLERHYQLKVRLLILSGRHAAHKEKRERYHTSMGEAALIEELKHLGGTPEYVFESKELLDYLIPMIYRDYQFNEDLQYNNEIVHAPILAHVGNQDADATQQDMASWSQLTTGDFTLKVFEGNHFFLFNDMMTYFKNIETDILEREEA